MDLTCFCKLWLGKALGSFEKPWETFGGFGFSIVCPSPRLWEALGNSGSLWEAVGSFGRLWKTLEGMGGLWKALEGFGRLWQPL